MILRLQSLDGAVQAATASKYTALLNRMQRNETLHTTAGDVSVV